MEESSSSDGSGSSDSLNERYSESLVCADPQKNEAPMPVIQSLVPQLDVQRTNGIRVCNLESERTDGPNSARKDFFIDKGALDSIRSGNDIDEETNSKVSDL